jgi:probable F420-dependent oxidoreductase
MRLAVEFPSVFIRQGPTAITALARGIEQLGYDQLDMFDHVTMAHPLEGRRNGPYPANMPIMEALTTLAYFAAVTERIGLGTEVLVLPQRQPALVAKQVGTIDLLSGGRVRLGVGVGWQEGEYESLDTPFRERGRRMDECLDLLRAYWTEPGVTYHGRHHTANAMAMEPKPRPGTAGPPIWMGGSAEVMLRRIGARGDGWLAGGGETLESARSRIDVIHRAAGDVGRDPAAIGLQVQLGDPRDTAQMRERAARFAELGFGWGTLSMTTLYQGGQRTVDAQLEALGRIREQLTAEVGSQA